jgi:hypothetical protein
MGMLDSFFNPGKAYKKADEAMQPYYQQSQQAIQPYMQHGQEAYGNLSGAMQSLLNPTELYDQWLGDYKQSDAAGYARERAENAGRDAANSMGWGGSTPATQAIQAGSARIGAEDEQRYMSQLLNQYLAGANIAQGIYGTGANAANQFGQNAMNMGQNSAQMAYGQQAAPGNLLGGLLGMGLGAFMPNSNGYSAWNTRGGR